MGTINHYKVLGVASDAEDIVIKAAYRALAQRYHPDRWHGDPVEASKRMAAINTAYSVLSDPIKRKQYDLLSSKDSDFDPEEKNGDFDDGLDDEMSGRWRLACEYYPDLHALSQDLAKLSLSLSFTFKLTLLETQAVKNRRELAQSIEANYLRKYFGGNQRIQSYAKSLILSGRKRAARDLNQAICVLGDDVEYLTVVNKIEEKWPADKSGQSDRLGEIRRQLLNAISYGHPRKAQLALAQEFANQLGATVEIVQIEESFLLIFTTDVPHFKVTEFGCTKVMTEGEFVAWVNSK